LNILN